MCQKKREPTASGGREPPNLPCAGRSFHQGDCRVHGDERGGRSREREEEEVGGVSKVVKENVYKLLGNQLRAPAHLSSECPKGPS